ncbi:MAG: D-alanyl-D-alanine carboxypeptidase [Alphaproteobacteria bacterium]|nr:D-alanyl-D-alanine carboxypeptidase [Alphaproteobacteria bacterium]
MHRTIKSFGRFAGAAIIAALAALAGLTGASPVFAQLEFDTKAPFAVLMDHESGTILFQKAADAPMAPASMAKLMTLAVVFNQLRNGQLSMQDELFISEDAWRIGGAGSGGSTMFAELNSKVSVENLVRSVIIQSGNDASIALAEGIGGSEATFARMMNELALELGLTNSIFTNSTGLPDENMKVTARDLANLARYIIREFPEYYAMFSEPEFIWNGIRQRNRNGLINDGIGVDGLKTGFIEEAGYGIVASTTEGGRRLIAVLHGLETSRERSEEARKLVTWGTRNFERIEPFAEGEIVGLVKVYGGELPEVGLVGEAAVALYVPKGSRKCLSARIKYTGPLLPPVARGDQVAFLEVLCDGKLIQSAPLYAAESVDKGDLVRQATDAFWELALGWL